MTATLSPPRSYAPVTVVRHCSQTGRPLTVTLPTGHTAEFMRSYTDCLRASLATLANVLYEMVPDCGSPDAGSLAITQVIADLGAWARSLGCRLRYHDWLCVDRGAWIGAIPAGEYGPSHAAVMCLDQVVHDPASNLPLPPNFQFHPAALADMTYSLTLDPLEIAP